MEMPAMLWINKMVLGNTLLRWVIAAALAAGLTALVRLVQRRLAPRLAARAIRTGGLLDLCLANLLARIHLLSLLAFTLFLGGQLLDLPARPARYLDLLPPLATIFQFAAWGHWAIGLWVDRRFLGDHGTRASRAAVAGFILRLALGALLLLLALDTLGFNITTLLASLGIGGIALALAVQNILGDLFASLSIALDQPFVIGDFIKVQEQMGTVQFIGLKTTRIRSLSGEQIIISNGDLLKSRIQNFKRMLERRVVFGFALSYRTPAEQVARIPGDLKRIVEQQPRVRFDRAHFQEFSSLGLKFEVVYYVLDPDFNLYMDIQQAMNLAILENFRDRGIAFCFPDHLAELVPGHEESR
jgi:small-conductance mechanosensitive channel